MFQLELNSSSKIVAVVNARGSIVEESVQLNKFSFDAIGDWLQSLESTRCDFEERAVFEFRNVTSNGLDVKVVFSNVLLDVLSKLVDVVDSFLFLCGEECVSSRCGTRERVNKNRESVCSLLHSSSVSVATHQFVLY